MASDEIVWSIINNQFCSFKLKLPGSHTHRNSTKQSFCRNPHNVTGLCNRQSCPLANSRYATIRADPSTQRLYLYIKTVERAHLPNRWWERIRLSSNYTRALDQVDERLRYWPKFLVHKCKQRLTRLTQVRMRAQRVAKEEERLGEANVAKLAPKIRRREETRERKAEAAAKIERAIERELVERLRSGAYGDRPLNVDEKVWEKVMKGLERGGEGVGDEDLDDGIEEEEEEGEREEEFEYEDEGAEVEYVSDLDESDVEEGDMEDFDDWLGGASADEEEEDGDGSGGEEDEEEGEEKEGDGDDEEVAALKKKLDSLKRKRPAAAAAAPPKPRKKSSKGPKTGIEYEYQPEAAQRQLLPAERG